MTSIQTQYSAEKSAQLRRKFTSSTITQRDLRAIEACMVRLMTSHPYYSSVLLGREIIITQAGTAAVDAAAMLLVNEEWFAALHRDEQIFVLAHEALHILFAHHLRMGSRDMRKCNIAMDAAINQWLIDDKVGRPPADCVTIDTVGAQLGWPKSKVEALRHASWEEIYYHLDADTPTPPPPPQGGEGDEGEAPDQPGQPGQPGSKPGQPGNQPGQPDPLADIEQGWGQVTPNTEATQEEIDRGITEANEAAQRALHEATLAGNASDTLRNAVARQMAHKADWRSILRNWMARGVNVREYTYARLPRRLSTWRLPAPVRGGTGKIIVLIDKSGSISEAATHAYVAEINAIIGETSPESVIVAAFDHCVHEPTTFGPGEQIEYTYEAGGGTSFAAALRFADENWMPGDKVLVFTDLEDRFPDAPEFAQDLLWVAVRTNERQVPRPTYGTIVDVPLSDI
jgi:predicted metal-dependent peptidase